MKSRVLAFCLTAAITLMIAAVSACNKQDGAQGGPGSENSLVSRGKQVYLANCIACHNTNPKNPGSLGPEVWGSSRELLEARILRAEYPAGYAPKRPTRAMAALPHLQPDIAAVHAYLNSTQP